MGEYLFLFDLQIKALEHLARHGVKCHTACMTSFSPPENIRALEKRLEAIHTDFEDMEREEIILYHHVEEAQEIEDSLSHSP